MANKAYAEYQNRYMVTCVPGAESLVQAEIRCSVGSARGDATARGKVFFDACLDPEAYGSIRSADNLYRVLAQFTLGPGKADLETVGRAMARIDLRESAPRPSAIVSASRKGKHAFTRFEVAGAAEKALTEAGKILQGSIEAHDLAIRLDVDRDICTVSKQLTPARFRFRSDAFHSAPGGIRPSAAHILIRLSNPRKNDVFYDPFCGAGTIPFERQHYPAKRIFASDIDPEIVGLARRNLGGRGLAFVADATRTTMKDAGVDALVTNMPWGKQINIGDMARLYAGFAAETKRILAPLGRAIVLTDQKPLLRTACEACGLGCAEVTELSLHGLHPSVFRIARR